MPPGPSDLPQYTICPARSTGRRDERMQSCLLVTSCSRQALSTTGTRYTHPGPQEGISTRKRDEEHTAQCGSTHLLVQHVRAGHGVKVTGLHQLLAHETQLAGSRGLGRAVKGQKGDREQKSATPAQIPYSTLQLLTPPAAARAEVRPIPPPSDFHGDGKVLQESPKALHVPLFRGKPPGPGAGTWVC